ncbi:rod-binding protein [Mycoplana rhizolycopersici]|uniref:Rod-binding protein n=1 Tax=Mycoplana rhizolycopersici TaxID=2746702 RepID=A0ABX2QCC3_9HYPH|nr:rod-binding protein [Rhizobium rhizolycopersici]
MAISPPSDLVLDVVRAADPASVQEAQAKLKSNRASFEANSLADAGAGFGAAVSILNRDSTASAATGASGVSANKAIPETYRKFEAMVLQNFVKSMLPADSEDVYGKGTAGEIWRGMMAEQIGDVISKSGGIGIAASLTKDNQKKSASGADIAVIDPNAQRVSTAMVQELQRNTFAGVERGDNNNDNKTA